MGVLLDLPNERAAISIRHRVFRLDLDVGVDARLERLLVRRHFMDVADFRDASLDQLRVHHVLRCSRPAFLRWRSQRTIRYTFSMRQYKHVSRYSQRIPRGQSAETKPDVFVSRWIRRALASDPPRARSLIVTVWGDALAPHGGGVWLAGLIRLMAPFGMSERLVRTSVFRLVRDGWLTTRSHGRRSRYRLTREGARRFDQAHHRIYAMAAPQW